MQKFVFVFSFLAVDHGGDAGRHRVVVVAAVGA